MESGAPKIRPILSQKQVVYLGLQLFKRRIGHFLVWRLQINSTKISLVPLDIASWSYRS